LSDAPSLEYHMQIGTRLKEIREAKNLSQGDIEKRTGLVRCYTSRVEHGHTVPSVETLEKFARALEIPLYQLFHEGEEAAARRKRAEERIPGWGETRRERHLFQQLIEALARMEPRNRDLLLTIAEQMVNRKSKRKAAHH
ncbi:MAG: helix-turn-helix domain-containing protein, partial [Candidatus Acidiferrales bacterium]